MLTKLIRNSRECGYVNFPVEIIHELTTPIDRMDRVCQCSKNLLPFLTGMFLAPSVFADFLVALADLTSDFFIEIRRVQRHVPEESTQKIIFTTDPQAIASNVCFSAVLSCKYCLKQFISKQQTLSPASSMRERNMSTYERLRVYQGASSKNSKNITFAKRSDLLENAIRDGDVATKELFTPILYSLLRFSVRFVSQFKPQIVKAILQEHPKSLNRAIDMLFNFVSSTNSIDEITVEK